MTIGPGVDGERSATRYAELGIPGVESSSPLMIFHWSCSLTAGEGTVAIGLLIRLCFIEVIFDKLKKSGRKMGRQAQRMAIAGSAIFQIMVLIDVSEKRIVADISFRAPSQSQMYRAGLYDQLTCKFLAHGLETKHSNDADGDTALREKDQYSTPNRREKCILGRLTVNQVRKFHTLPLSAFEAFGGSRPCQLAAPRSTNQSQRWKPQIVLVTREIAGIGRLNSIDRSMGYIGSCWLCKRRPNMPLRTQCWSTSQFETTLFEGRICDGRVAVSKLLLLSSWHNT